MTQRIIALTPGRPAGMSSILSLAVAAAGMVTLAVRSALLARADAAATANAVLSSEPTARLGFAANLVGAAFAGVLALIFRTAFLPAKLAVAFLAFLFHLGAAAFGAIAMFIHLAPLLLERGAHAYASIAFAVWHAIF